MFCSVEVVLVKVLTKKLSDTSAGYLVDVRGPVIRWLLLMGSPLGALLESGTTWAEFWWIGLLLSDPILSPMPIASHPRFLLLYLAASIKLKENYLCFFNLNYLIFFFNTKSIDLSYLYLILFLYRFSFFIFFVCRFHNKYLK